MSFKSFYYGSIYHQNLITEPWLGRKKKAAKKKKPTVKKKAASTQDKIETMFERKCLAPAPAPAAAPAQGGRANGLYLGGRAPAAAPASAPAPARSAIERACSMKEQLLAAVERLGRRLPPNTLDQLVDELGGTDNVAEVRFMYCILLCRSFNLSMLKFDQLKLELQFNIAFDMHLYRC